MPVVGQAARAAEPEEGTNGEAAGDGCSFSGETLVLMADGSKKPINSIRIGDRVRATDPKTGKQTARRVTKVWRHVDRIVRLRIDGDELATTTNHPFWDASDHRWVPAGKVHPGDLLVTAEGRLVHARRIDVRARGGRRTT